MIKMTRAEYEAKYGTPPPIPNVGTTTNTSAPIKMTHAEYMAKYGGVKENAGFLTRVKNAISSRINKAGEAQQNAIEGKQSLLSGTLQTIGQGAGAVGDVALEGVKSLTPDFIEQPITKFLSQAFNKASETKTVQSIASWAQQHPEAAKNLESVLNIGSLFPVGKGAQLAGKGIEKTAQQGLKTVSLVGEKIAQRGTEKVIQNVIDLTAEPLNKQGRIDLLKITGKTTKTGQPLGAEKSGLFKTIKPVNTASDIERGNVVKNLVSNDALESIANLNREASNISEKVVRPYLQANPRAFNLKTISARLDTIETPIVFKADPVLDKTYSLIRQRMVDFINKNPKTMEGLWNARTQFDQAVKNEFGDLAFDSPQRSAVRRGIQDMRRAVNDYISSETGDKTFSESMKKLNYIYESAENIAETNNKIFGTNKFQRWGERHPTLVNIIKYGGGGILAKEFLYDPFFGK